MASRFLIKLSEYVGHPSRSQRDVFDQLLYLVVGEVSSKFLEMLSIELFLTDMLERLDD